jgi:putative endonuclease
MKPMYYVYVLRKPRQFYTGSTANLEKRFAEHVANKVFATKNRGPWSIVYYEACRMEKDARQREKYLKTAWGKRYLKSRLKNDIQLSHGV